jgi:hypothetical protein
VVEADGGQFGEQPASLARRRWVIELGGVEQLVEGLKVGIDGGGEQLGFGVVVVEHPAAGDPDAGADLFEGGWVTLKSTVCDFGSPAAELQVTVTLRLVANSLRANSGAIAAVSGDVRVYSAASLVRCSSISARCTLTNRPWADGPRPPTGWLDVRLGGQPRAPCIATLDRGS